MVTENLSTLKIHKLSQAQYDRELAAGNIDGNAFYLTPDDTADQLSEVLTLIEINKDTLESLVSTKVNVSDIVDNLSTNSNSRVLSAAQGVAIKTLIDVLQAEVDTKASASDLSAHTGNKSNPHGVTATQIGALPLSGGSIAGSSDTPLYIQSTTKPESWIGFRDLNNTLLGYLGFYKQNVPAYFPGSGSGAEYLLHSGNYTDYTATKSEFNTLSEKVTALENSVVTVHSGTEEPISELGKDGDIYLVTG